ncbi:MAG: 30S ribosomal protein S2 [Planctomycetes bacterium]|nr:30S ribosomal protein S2 [Planctomycetota bacterium]
MAKELARELVNAGVHFGHGASRWNPKMAPYIFGKRGNIHIIDVKQTLRGVLIAKKLLAELVSSGSDVVFVGTKRQAQKAVEAAAAKCQMHCISQRWLGGMLTNFRTVRSRLQRLEQLEAMEQSGTLEKESKKQASRLKREMRKIFTNLDGVRRMSRLPGCVVVVDAKKEYLALREAKRLGIPTIGILDTDSDPDTVDLAIPANDDSIKAIELILSELADAVAVGKTLMSLKPDTATSGPAKSGRSRRVLARADGDDKMVVAAEAVASEVTAVPGAAAAPAPEATPAPEAEATPAAAPEVVSDPEAAPAVEAPAADTAATSESDEQTVS